ncbi:Mitochondrial chaperone BCS1 [Mycena indigotica]|uniref:Mitochondrial chaperone BCS1 n=1 Tax=Mycena indigotica TaxID=2126181 RepID=A0A8H6W955_9AGAR|nr:Mitochondrial chaperone BCS1 [Mycena indigotica]KAF7303789.1 Mitochondrial chaperone BCS1 [Mycena indigotica]
MTEALLPVFQQILSSFTGTTVAATTHNVTAEATAFNPSSVSSFLTFLLSFSALRDWAKLALLGGIVEVLRRFLFGGYHTLVDLFWISATFSEEDSSYDWMMVWLSKQPGWRHVRQVQVSTNSLATSRILLDGENDMTHATKSSRKLAYLPSLSTTYHLWYKHRWLSVTRVQTNTGWWGSKEQTLFVNILTRDHRILSSLLQEARAYHIAAQEHKISVYVSDTNNNWRSVARRDKRPLDSIVLDPGQKDLLIADAKDFLKSKEWYQQRAIPHRRGYLLYGAPGSGKSSVIHAIAGELGLDVYIISLSRVGLGDSELNELVNALPERCCALMEDIDAAFTSGLTRESKATISSPDTSENMAAKPGTAGNPPPTSRLSLSGLLNALDGVGAQEGRILFATTNKYEALDPALCRPGRMDVHVEFKLASSLQAKKLFCRFYLPTEDPDSVIKSSTVTGTDSGYSSDGDESLVLTADRVFSPQQIVPLADRFSEAIPERTFSMAALQGFLMTCKARPEMAAKTVKAWVERERNNGE